MRSHPSGRSYVRVYEGVRRAQHHDYLQSAVRRAGGRVLWSSGPSVAPLYMAVEEPDGAIVGAMAYVFLANRNETRNRPADEHRTQVRYGDVNDPRWRAQHHPVGFDPAAVDVTLVLAVNPDADVIVALDPLLYDPLPLGISVFFKDAEIGEAARSGWHVWARDNISGARRGDPRAELGVETVVGFAPVRLLDYVRLERQAQALRLDPPLRYRAALRASKPRVDMSQVHELEREFELPAEEIVELIAERSRLSMAVRGGVAEHHMGRILEADKAVAEADVGHQEGPPDFFVRMRDGRRATVEVKNASPHRYKDGTPKVEVQKTRASKGDPTSRLYPPSAFDVLAACMYGPTGSWTFRYKRADRLTEHPKHAGRINPLQRIDDTWAATLADALAEPAR
ncbi:MAG: hypothetical protein WD993_07560 [Thermoleophilaceae bacterium]